MSFFQNSVLNKHLKGQDAETVKAAYQKFTAYFQNTAIQQNIREAKEEQFQEGFLRELFVNNLGYTLNPQPDFNLTTELKNEIGAKKCDGAILQDGKALGVIELKGTDTKDLDKINVQAFNYKNNQTGCVYVITSNFEKLRFFIHHAVEHLEFNLFTLTETEFQLLWLCLRAENLLNGVPLKVKEESLLAEENITKQLYKDYSAFKTDMWQNMSKNHPQDDQLMLFKKTQKLLDRFLFIFFAEDSGLLPPNSISKIIEKWKQDTDWGEDRKLYDIYKQYFGFINTGRPARGGRAEIFGFNGGLFHIDLILDNIKIDDEILLKHTEKLTAYDFQSEVDVNILGHIFENSLTEIDSITAELEGQELDKSKTKRKKDGVFYTPKYITKYIVDNTIGKLCEEKKVELNITDERFAQAGKRSKKGIEDIQAYRNWLLDLKICDPACGSGAFLNQALEFLIDEHQYLDELTAQYHKTPLVLSDIETQILEQNIYGVDINEESVEIAKLSLWLRTAQRGRKLTTLNNNIKCGNSLIDDPEVAGEKAFNWQKEFPKVFNKGGFDVVIGNPPYVRVQNLDYNVIDWLKSNKQSAYKRIDISTLFIEEGLKLINKGGVISYITSNQFFKAEYGRKLRQLIKGHLFSNIDFSNVSVFEGLATYVSILNFTRKTVDKLDYGRITDTTEGIENIEFHEFKFKNFTDESWDFNVNQGLKDKIYQDSKLLGDCADFVYGIITGNDAGFIVADDVVTKLKLERGILFDFVKPENYESFAVRYLDKFIIYPYKDNNEIYHEDELQRLYPNAYDYLQGKKEELENRKDSRVTIKEKGLDWYVIMRRVHPKEIETTKIIFYDVGGHPNFCFDDKGFAFGGGTSHSLTIKDDNQYSFGYLLALLNSKLMNWIIMDICPVKMGGARKYGLDYMRKLPIKSIEIDEQKLYAELATKMAELKTSFLGGKHQFIDLLKSKFDIEKLSKKLQNWHELEFKDFLKELKKAKVQLGLSEDAEWMQYFNEQKQKAQELKSEINRVDAEIDRMVYALYGLTEEEIKIMEES